MMKKIAAGFAALCFVIILLAACVSQEGGSSPSSTGEADPAGSYNAYSEARNLAFENIAMVLGSDPEFYMELEPTLMASMSVDFSVMPVMALDGKEETLSMLEHLDFSGVKIEQQDDGYVITFKGPDGADYTQSCTYDASLDHMQSQVAGAGGNETAFFEYVRAGDGYAGQYYISGAEYPLVKIFTSADYAAIGVGTSSEKPAGITKDAVLGPDLVKGCDVYFVLKGKELTVFYNGETRTIK